MPFAAIAVAIFINALWGGNPIAVKVGLEVVPPFWSAFLRFAIGAACVACWAAMSGMQLWPKRYEWVGLIWLSVLFGVQIAAMNIGIDRSSGAISAVLIAMYPLFAAGLSHVYGPGERLTRARTVGLLVAFAGAAVIVMRQDAGGWLGQVGVGELIVLFSAALLGARLVVSAVMLRRMNTARVMFWQMLIALPAFWAIALTNETVVWSAFSWEVGFSFFYQGVVIAGFGFVGPVTGVFLGISLLGEPVTLNLVIGTIAVGCGLVIVAARRRTVARS